MYYQLRNTQQRHPSLQLAREYHGREELHDSLCQQYAVVSGYTLHHSTVITAAAYAKQHRYRQKIIRNRKIL